MNSLFLRRTILLSKLAFKDLMRNPIYLTRLVLILSLGMMGMRSIFTFQEKIFEQLQGSAKQLLGADISLSVRRLFTKDEEKQWKEILSREIVNQKNILFGHDVSMLGLISAGEKVTKIGAIPLPAMFNTRWYSENFPKYSKAIFQSGNTSDLAWDKLHKGNIFYMPLDQARRYGLEVGDEVKIFGKNFILADLVLEDSATSLRFFNLFPTAYFSYSHLENLGVLTSTSTLFHSLYAYFLEPINSGEMIKIKKTLEKHYIDPAISISLPQDSSNQNSRLWNVVSDFLGLLSMATTFLSFIGILALQLGQWVRRSKDYFVLQWFGPSKKYFLLFLLLQKGIISLFATVSCLLFSIPIQIGLASFLPPSFSLGLTFFTFNDLFFLFPGLFILTTLGLLIVWWHQENHFTNSTIKSGFLAKWKWPIFYGSSFSFFFILGRILSRSWLLSASLLVALIVTLILLSISFYLIIFIFKKYFHFDSSHSPKMIYRLVFRSWQYRRFTYMMLAATLGLSLLLHLLLTSMDRGLKTQLQFDPRKPELFLFDIQKEDLENLKNIVSKSKAQLLSLSPLIRGRLVSINDVPVERVEEKREETREEEEESRFKFRSINVTYRQTLSPFEKVVEGQSLPPTFSSQDPSKDIIPISLEYRYAKRLKIKLHDVVVFDFGGLIIKSRVINLRSVFWLSFHPNFFIVFPDGVINNIPSSFLAVIKTLNDAPKSEEIIISKIIQTMPHVSTIFLKGVIKTIADQITKLMSALGFLSIGFTILSLFLWVTVVYDRLFQASEEMALLRLQGFSSTNLVKLYLFEFSALLSFVFILIPCISYFTGIWIANEFFDGLFIWSWVSTMKELVSLYLVVFFLTLLIVQYFSSLTAKQLLNYKGQ